MNGVRSATIAELTEGDPTHTPIRLLVADNHQTFRTGLAALLASRSDIEVVAQAASGRAALQLADELHPDVVLIDLRLPDLTGRMATREILERNPSTRVVVLAAQPDDSDLSDAIDAGARGCFTKDTPIEEMVAAVRAAMRGAPWLSQRAAKAALAWASHPGPQGPADPDRTHQLSDPELDVLRLIAQGLDTAEVAKLLDISPQTAERHISNIVAGLGLPMPVPTAAYAAHEHLD